MINEYVKYVKSLTEPHMFHNYIQLQATDQLQGTISNIKHNCNTKNIGDVIKQDISESRFLFISAFIFDHHSMGSGRRQQIMFYLMFYISGV